MVDDAVARALAPSAPEHAQAAAVATIVALAARARSGHAREALTRVAGAASVGSDLRAETALLANGLSPDEGTDQGGRADRALGVIDELWVLGPFRDTGGGIHTHDGPEPAGALFDPAADYSWGSYEVAWRKVPRAFAGARGVPLDLFVFPRRESCSWVAAHLVVDKAEPIVVRVASSGQVRLLFDGTDVGRDENVHESARFDRVAASVNADTGGHLLAAKVCSGALGDDGRVRLRVTNDGGQWPEVVASTRPWDKLRRPQKTLAVRPMTTPLGRAIDTPSSSQDARLDAAILRRLGGADDLRSPRAPGMLSALADGGMDGDRLAMAAWITPSGANRSAWLTRARPSADEQTRSFVDRRLVERHLEAQLVDWAMASLRGAKIDAAGDAESRLLSAQVQLALGTDASRLQTMRALKAAMDSSPSTVPDALLELLGHAADGLDNRAALTARELLATRGQTGADRVRTLASARPHPDAIRAALQAFATGGVQNADEALAVAQTIARTGQHKEALLLYQQLAGWAPNRASVWAGFAQEIGAGPNDTARDQAIATALGRARELDPGEARYRVELALRAQAATPAGESHGDEKYLVHSQAILERRQGSAGEVPDVADRELHWLRAVLMHDDRRVSEMVHYAREVVIAPRTEDELYEDIPAEGDLTEILRARVHHKDGTTAFLVEEANENAHPRIRWPELVSGDVVEVAFRSWTGGPVGGRADPPFYRLDYAGSLSTHPVLYNEVIVESPHDRPIFVDVVNGRPDHRDDKEDGGRHVARLVWSKPTNVPDEPLAPPLSEVIPTVVMSTFKDWNAFRSWYGEAVRGFTEPDAQVRSIAESLTRGKITRDDKLRALFEFVADDIRYVNYVSGERWLPNRPQQLLARREGDCDDKALLLITLLKAVGVGAQEVMVQTRLTAQPSIVRAPGAAIPLFDHGIAFVPGPNGGTYLDATSPQSRLGPLPSMDARAIALRMDGAPDVVELPASTPDDHGVDATWTLKLAANGSVDLDGDERAVGDDAFWMRTYLTEPGARAQFVEDRLVGGWFSTVQVDKTVEFHGDLPRGAARVHWRARSDRLARREGAELVVPLSPSQTLASQLAPLVRRTLPVWLPPHVAPRKEARAIRLIAPKGWKFEALPPGGDENGGPFGHAHLDVTRDPNDAQAIVAKRTVVFDQSAVTVQDYPKWRAWVQRVDALMHRAVRLMPNGSTR
jgi:transglutaminase-like putative cysteine protease